MNYSGQWATKSCIYRLTLPGQHEDRCLHQQNIDTCISSEKAVLELAGAHLNAESIPNQTFCIH